MPYSVSNLRTPPDEFPYRERHVTFIQITQGGEISQAQGVQEKMEMLRSLNSADALIAAWTGQWRTDIFLLDHGKAHDALI